jgi:hypothetical protein
MHGQASTPLQPCIALWPPPHACDRTCGEAWGASATWASACTPCTSAATRCNDTNLLPRMPGGGALISNEIDFDRLCAGQRGVVALLANCTTYHLARPDDEAGRHQQRREGATSSCSSHFECPLFTCIAISTACRSGAMPPRAGISGLVFTHALHCGCNNNDKEQRKRATSRFVTVLELDKCNETTSGSSAHLERVHCKRQT